MNDQEKTRAAEILGQYRLQRTPLTPLPDTCAPRNEAHAYAIQDLAHAYLSEAGLGPVVGHKIGCTTPVMQAYLGIEQPCAGGIFGATVHHQAGRFRASDYRRLGVECEIAVTLGRHLPCTTEPYQRDDVATAVESCMAAIEVVDDRYQDYHTLGVYTLIADDFFNAGCVLGEPIKDWWSLDLTAVRGQMQVNGARVGSGNGADIMGHPLEALTWLANRYSTLGKGLHAGTFVLLGSVVQTQWLVAGDEVHIQIEGLGEAEVKIE